MNVKRLQSPVSPEGHRGIPRAVWQAIAVLAAATLAYAIWRAYQNPDFVLEFGAYMLC